MKKRYLETLDGDGYKVYLYWAGFTVLMKFALSVSWMISVIIAMGGYAFNSVVVQSTCFKVKE